MKIWAVCCWHCLHTLKLLRSDGIIFSSEELVKALLSHIKFPLGSSAKCTLRKQQVPLGIICALLSKFLKAMVEHALGIFLDVTEPQEVDHHVWKYLFCMLAFCNEIASV